MDTSQIKIMRLSYKKIQLDYNVPVYMVSYKGDRMKGDVIKISIRYEKIKGENNYWIISKSVHDPIERLHFKYKVGTHTQNGYGYHINNINVEYSEGSPKTVTFEGRKINLIKFVEAYIVGDRNYINIVRDKKLEDIFS